jgi:hypothetical protein
MGKGVRMSEIGEELEEGGERERAERAAAGRAESDAFRLALLADLRPRPESALQILLAERIVLNNWRLLRGAPVSVRPRRLCSMTPPH